MNAAVSEAWIEAIIDSKQRRLVLEPGANYYIGRDQHNTIVLADHQVSRRHAMLQRLQTGECYVVDLGSRNGTLVNDKRVVVPVFLRQGDRIVIGGCELVFHSPAEHSRASTTLPAETVVDFSEGLVTVLVADIRDFTGLSRRLPETRLSEVISAFTRDSGRVLTEQGAWGQKYIGDAVMGIWRHPSNTADVRDMVRIFGALDLIFEIASGLQPKFALDAPIRIGAGINTGLAAVGNVGGGGLADHTALSSAVNLAFRLESATKEIGRDVALGQTTYELLAAQGVGQDVFEPYTVRLKGFEEPKPTYATSRNSLGLLLENLRRQLSPNSARI